MILTALASRADLRVYDQVIGPAFLDGATGKQVLEHVFDRSPDHTRATILPVAWFNARECFPGFWEELQERRVHVIHMRRRNLLRRYVSRELARTTGSWIAIQPAEASRTVTIDAVSCRLFVEHERRAEAMAASFFAEHDQLDLYYEDLIRDYDRQLERVQTFLGVVPQRLRPSCHKQARNPLSELVRNYSELRHAWEKTPWADWLSDEVESTVETAGPGQRRGRLISE
jgi:hypothetical protein